MSLDHKWARTVADMVRGEGLVVVEQGRHRNGHLRVVVKKQGRRTVLTTSGTPSDWRGIRNLRALVRRLAKRDQP